MTLTYIHLKQNQLNIITHYYHSLSVHNKVCSSPRTLRQNQTDCSVLCFLSISSSFCLASTLFNREILILVSLSFRFISSAHTRVVKHQCFLFKPGFSGFLNHQQNHWFFWFKPGFLYGLNYIYLLSRNTYFFLKL
jgi:hypothetical protein